MRINSIDKEFRENFYLKLKINKIPEVEFEWNLISGSLPNWMHASNIESSLNAKS